MPGAALQAILRAHSHVVPAEPQADLQGAVSRAMEAVLGEGPAASLRSLVQANCHPRGAMSGAEATMLWLLNNLPGRANEILKRARLLYANGPGAPR